MRGFFERLGGGQLPRGFRREFERRVGSDTWTALVRPGVLHPAAIAEPAPCATCPRRAATNEVVIAADALYRCPRAASWRDDGVLWLTSQAGLDDLLRRLFGVEEKCAPDEIYPGAYCLGITAAPGWEVLMVTELEAAGPELVSRHLRGRRTLALVPSRPKFMRSTLDMITETAGGVQTVVLSEAVRVVGGEIVVDWRPTDDDDVERDRSPPLASPDSSVVPALRVADGTRYCGLLDTQGCRSIQRDHHRSIVDRAPRELDLFLNVLHSVNRRFVVGVRGLDGVWREKTIQPSAARAYVDLMKCGRPIRPAMLDSVYAGADPARAIIRARSVFDERLPCGSWRLTRSSGGTYHFDPPEGYRYAVLYPLDDE